MGLAEQALGLDRLLFAIYGEETGLHALLEALGYTPEQRAQLAGERAPRLIVRLLAMMDGLLRDRAAGGETTAFVVDRRFGLDGLPESSLDEIAGDLGVSPERISLVLTGVLQRLRKPQVRHLLMQRLDAVAREALASDTEP
jgi:DNA-directed RNA polymerase sigma subunit (sigma70/sigma32)